jgi:nucleoside-diphosphate-sugar epimerase
MFRVLITGGCGYLGSAVVATLVDLPGTEIVVVDQILYGVVPEVMRASNVQLLVGDIRDAELIRSAVEGVDAVIHLAAIVGEPACLVAPEYAEPTNLAGTDIVLSLARESGVGRFIFASSCSIYSTSNDSDANRLPPYALHKLRAEQNVLENHGKMSATVARLATLCGLSERPRFDLVLNRFVADSLQGQVIRVHGSGENSRPLLHVRDAAAQICRLLVPELVAAPVLNIGRSEQILTIRELAELVCTLIPEAEWTYEAIEGGDERSYTPNFEWSERNVLARAEWSLEFAVYEQASAIRAGLNPSDRAYDNAMGLRHYLKSEENYPITLGGARVHR